MFGIADDSIHELPRFLNPAARLAFLPSCLGSYALRFASGDFPGSHRILFPLVSPAVGTSGLPLLFAPPAAPSCLGFRLPRYRAFLSAASS